MATLGTKLLKLRQEHKLSQAELAEILGVSQTTYGCWESGAYCPRKENLVKIAQYYNIDIKYLLDDKEKTKVVNRDISNVTNFLGNANNSTFNFQQSPEILELLKTHEEQIFKLMTSQQELQIQTSKILESHFKLLELINKKN